MVRVSKALLKEAVENGISISKNLTQFLVCPLSKQSLRYCEQTNSLISDTIGVSFPIKDGIPCLVPKDGKILEDDDITKPDAIKDGIPCLVPKDRKILEDDDVTKLDAADGSSMTN